MTDKPYVLGGPLRRPAGKFVLRPLDSKDGLKGRASFLADSLGGRWSRQAGGYVLSSKAARDFETLFAAGFTGRLRLFADTPPGFEHERLGFADTVSRAHALKLAAQWINQDDR